MKPIAFAASSSESVELAAPAAGEGEDERDGDVLDDEDREDEVGLVVGQPPEVDQPLDGDRRRGDVDRAGEDDGREREPERRHADDQAEARR